VLMLINSKMEFVMTTVKKNKGGRSRSVSLRKFVYICNLEDEYYRELCSGDCDICEFEEKNYKI
jgi:hypothetical protein